MATDTSNKYEKIRSYLSDASIELRCFETTDSTNTQARKYALEGGRCPCAFVAEEQSAGRGRMGRSFYSPSGTGIYFSLLVRSRGPLEDAVCLTSAAAVAIHRAIRSVTGIVTEIKWVNDLYFNGRKVCGILAESFSSGEETFLVIGVGINICTDAFPEELSKIAGSLGVKGEGAKDKLTARCISELALAASDLSGYEFLDEYREHSMILGKRISFTEGGDTSVGVAESIDARGRLCVRLEDGTERILSSGEISVRTIRNTKER